MLCWTVRVFLTPNPEVFHEVHFEDLLMAEDYVGKVRPEVYLVLDPEPMNIVRYGAEMPGLPQPVSAGQRTSGMVCNSGWIEPSVHRYLQLCYRRVMARVLGRLRLSRSNDASTSIDRQRQVVTDWASRENHDIVGWAVDVDVSGSVRPFEAPELAPWFEPDRMGDWDILVSASMDRLSRNLFDFTELCQWVQKNDKKLYTVKESLDLSGMAGKMIALVLGMVAEGELEAIRDRVKASRKQLRTTGRWPGGVRPYGYMAVQKNEDGEYGWYLEPDPEESEIVTEIFLRARDGESPLNIAKDLITRNVPSRHSKDGRPRWTQRTIQDILRSRAPLGQSTHKGTVVVGDDGMPLQVAKPLISFDLWSEVQVVRAERSINRTRKFAKGILLNVAFCKSCGAPLYALNNRKGDKTYRYWRCSTRQRPEGGDCRLPGINAEQLESFVADQVLEEIGNIPRTRRVFQQAEGYADEISRVDEAIARLRAESDAGLYEGNLDEYLARLSPLIQRRKTLAALPNRPAQWVDINTGETFGEAWERMDNNERRQLLLDAGVRVEAMYQGKGVPDFSMTIDVPSMSKAVPGYSADHHHPEAPPPEPVDDEERPLDATVV